MGDTILEISGTRKCPLALVLIAPRYAASPVSERVLDVGGKGRIGESVVPELSRHDAELDRKREYVDELLAFVTNEKHGGYGQSRDQRGESCLFFLSLAAIGR